MYWKQRNGGSTTLMITEMELRNYRCFENSKIVYKNLNVLVGKNNAGKSSMIEALRMVAYASQKAMNAAYRDAPSGLNISGREKGIRIDVEKLKIDLRGIVYLYEDKIAQINVCFDDGCKILIAANKEIAYAFLYGPDGKNIKSNSTAKKYSFTSIGILPQIGLIKENESILTKDTINSHRESYLSSRHFRNEVWLYKDKYWKKFKQLAEENWESLKIIELKYNITESEYIRLLVQDEHFPGEIGIMGSGLQMWLQMIWFICRSEDKDTIILDEPDVYMHPDLQKKLLNLVKRNYKQVIIATHSVEIISDVDPGNIVMIDKHQRKMKYANNLEAVQSIIDNIGGVQNLSLIRIGLSKKCLFLEGKDIKIMQKLFEKLYPDKDSLISTLPYIELQGFANLNEAFGASQLFYSETKGGIKCICILDRDFYPDEVLVEKKEKAKENHLYLHIWEKKEIENYLLIPEAIFRITKLPKEKHKEFLLTLEKLVEDEKDDIQDQIAQHLKELNTGWSISTCNKQAREIIKEKWKSLEEKLSLVSGKIFIRKLNGWMRREYGVFCSTDRIIKEIRADEVENEMVEVLNLFL